MRLMTLNKHKKEQREEIEHGFFFKILDVIDYPFKWLRKLTIPPLNEDEYEHKYLVIWPLLGIPFLVLNFFKGWWFLLYFSALSLLLPIVFYKLWPEENKVPKYFLFVVIVGVASSILWTKMCCALLVDLLTFVGRLTGLSSTYLGLTVIAVGNALGDGLTTIALAKKGQAVLGLTGGIAGQLLGLLIGFGCSMLKKTLKEGEQSFELFNMSKINENLLLLIVIGFALMSLIFIFVIMTVNDFKMTRNMGLVLLFIYTTFIVCSTGIAIKQAFF